jgi:hypothetical protein
VPLLGDVGGSHLIGPYLDGAAVPPRTGRDAARFQDAPFQMHLVEASARVSMTLTTSRKSALIGCTGAPRSWMLIRSRASRYGTCRLPNFLRSDLNAFTRSSLVKVVFTFFGNGTRAPPVASRPAPLHRSCLAATRCMSPAGGCADVTAWQACDFVPFPPLRLSAPLGEVLDDLTGGVIGRPQRAVVVLPPQGRAVRPRAAQVLAPALTSAVKFFGA